MPTVTVLILAPLPDPAAGPLERILDDARAALAEHHRAGFLAAGATGVVVHREPPDDTPFGARLRRLAVDIGAGGLVVLGARDLRERGEHNARQSIVADNRMSRLTMTLASTGNRLSFIRSAVAPGARPIQFRWIV
ncbi:MAG: hypothetical protein WCK58_11160, partial [Chloroflexota bacterium]